MLLNGKFENEPMKMKIIIVGDSGVGKTNIKNQFCHKKFDVVSHTTIGIQYAIRNFWGQWNGKKQLFALHFWDAAGVQNQQMITPLFFKNALGVIYVYDITKRQSLNSLERWRQITLKNNNTNLHKEILVGNKKDLDHFRQVKEDQGQKWAHQNSIRLFKQVSALKDCGIKQAVAILISQIMKQIQVVGIYRPIKLDIHENYHHGCC